MVEFSRSIYLHDPASQYRLLEQSGEHSGKGELHGALGDKPGLGHLS